MAQPIPKRNDVIEAYRAGETLPKKLNVHKVIAMAQGAYMARALGMPSIGVDELVNKMLVEGREDAGTNSFNHDNKKSQELFSSLRELGIDVDAAEYAAAVLDKSQVASRLGIPFERAWNGTGKSAETGRTGQQHADRAEASKGAAKDPRNAPLVDLIKRAGAADLTDIEKLVSTPYSQPAALWERYGVETPIRMDDYRVEWDVKNGTQTAFDDMLRRTGTAWGYRGGKPAGVSNVELGRLLEMKDRKERGENSLTTQTYERIMMTDPALASTVGTIAAKTGPDPAPEYKAPRYSSSNESVLDQILSYFKN